MTTLVFVDHDNITLKDSPLNAVNAASQLGDNIHLLVTGSNCGEVVNAASRIEGVEKVIVVDSPSYKHPLAEAIGALVISLSSNYSAIIAAATTTGKNFLPRVAAALDVMQISDIISVESNNTFKRPIYAGNAIQTIQSSDAKKVITVRTTAFKAALSEGGSAKIENIDALKNSNSSSFVKAETEQTILQNVPKLVTHER